MKKLSFWQMSSKLNITLFAVFGGFYTLIAIGIADNRFEHDAIVYILLSLIWLIVILNLVSLKIINTQMKLNKDISIFHKVLISITMVGVILILFSSSQHNGSIPYHQPNNDDQKNQES